MRAVNGQSLFKYALSDFLALGHFLVKKALVANIQKVTNQVKMTLLNGKRIKSAHTFNLSIPWLLQLMTEAHVVTGLTHFFLISTQDFFKRRMQNWF